MTRGGRQGSTPAAAVDGAPAADPALWVTADAEALADPSDSAASRIRSLLGDEEANDGDLGVAGRRRDPVLRRAIVGLGVLALVHALLVGGGACYLTKRYAGTIDRVAGVLDDQSRPAPTTAALPVSRRRCPVGPRRPSSRES